MTGDRRLSSRTGLLTADRLVPLSPSGLTVPRAVDEGEPTFWVTMEERNGSQMARVPGLSLGPDDTIKSPARGARSLPLAREAVPPFHRFLLRRTQLLPHKLGCVLKRRCFQARCSMWLS